MTMQQVKIFKGVESDLTALEQEVNGWLRQSGARVVSVTGNIAPQTVTPESKGGGVGRSYYPPSDVILIFLYEPADA